MKLPKPIGWVLAKVGIRKSPPESQEVAEDEIQRRLRLMHIKATIAICVLAGLGVFLFFLSSKNVCPWGISLAFASLVGMYVMKSFSTQAYPDKIVVLWKGNPIWVYDTPNWRFFLWPFYTWAVKDGKIIDVNLPNQEIIVRYKDKAIKLKLDLFGSFQLDDRALVEGKKPAILSYKLKNDEQRWDYFATEIIDIVSSVLGEYENPSDIIQNQHKIENKVKKLLSSQCKKVGYKVIDHNMKIDPEHVGLDADAIRIQGTARAEVAEAFGKAVKDNWEATTLTLGTTFIEALKQAVLVKKESKEKGAEKIGEKIDTLVSTIGSLEEAAKKVLS